MDFSSGCAVKEDARFSSAAGKKDASAWRPEVSRAECGRSELSRSQRIRKGSDYRQTLRNGVRSDCRLFILVGRPRTAGPSRLGLAVSRRVGPAVVRNRVKRLLREVFRRHKSVLRIELDLVVLPKQSMRGVGFLAVEECYLAGASKLGGRLSRRQRGTSVIDRR